MTLRARILLLVLLGMLAPVLLRAFILAEEREERVAEAQRQLSVTAQRIAKDLEDVVRATAQLHYGLSRARDLDGGDRAACSDFLAGVLKEFPQYTGIITIRPDGSLFCDSLRTGRTLNLTDRRYFQAALAAKTPLALEPVFGRLTGVAVLQIAYAVRGAGGEPRFVLIGVPGKVLTAAADQRLIHALALLALIALLIFAGAWVLAELGIRRPVARIAGAVARIRSGELGARIGKPYAKGELGGLMSAIDATAERIQAQNDEVRRLNEGLEQRVAERTRELEAAIRAKSEFMNNVTHELRTPLNSVIGFAELLKDGVPGPLNAKQAGFVADIHESGLRLLKLVEGILDMSRLDADGVELEREPVEIGSALTERVRTHRAAAEAQRVSITLEVAAGVGSAELDPKALRRMLDALLDNAIKFNRDGGAVAVSARRADGAIEISVADTGVGITQEDLAKLFKPLVQLDAGLARQHGGVGLGLALARRLAELHGGTIEVASESGKGSTFTVRLPCRQMDLAALG